jgi:hypothetical protein
MVAFALSIISSLRVTWLIPALLLICHFAKAQHDSSKNKVSVRSLKLLDATCDFYTTLNGNKSFNSLDEQVRNQIYFYYNLTVQNRIKIKKIRISNYYFNEFGIRNYKDSIVVISEDIYNFKNSIAVPIRQSKFALNITISSKSQFWKHYTYQPDSNNRYIKSLHTAHLSPGYTIYSGGIRYNFWDRSSIELGIASGKTTKIKNQDIFTQRQAARLYGLEAGKLKKTVLGFHLLLNISSKKLFKNCYMEQFSQLFVDKDSLKQFKSYSLDVNNAFHYLFLKYIRFSFRTKLLYDQTVFLKPSLVQQFSIGFYLNNQL